MARKEKVDNAVLKRLERQASKRVPNSKVKQKFYLIVCEGEKTEPNYFEGLKKELPQRVLELVDLEVRGTGRNTLGVIEEALRAKKNLEQQPGRVIDEVWAVFDRDDFPPENFNSAILKRQQGKKKVHCTWTNEAFELWYLLHFQNYEQALEREQYQSLLEQQLKQRMGQPYKYEKRSPEMFTLLSQFGELRQAIKRAKRLEEAFAGRTDYANHNPCTRVYALVEKLLYPESAPQ